MAKKSHAQDTITIDKNVPFPGPTHRWHNKWPFGSMEIGHSFAVQTFADVPLVRAASSYYGKRNGLKFSVRKTPGMPAPYRCWRVE